MAKVKVFFKKVGLWFKNHAPSKRRLIQVYTALLYNANIKGFVSGRIYTGKVKNACVPGLNCYSCPGAAGACPLGALQDSLANSDTTAPYYIIGILALFGLIFARTICGFFCPVGLGQELLYKVKTPKLKKSRYTRLLSYLKYILLAVMVIAIPLIYNGIPAFCKYICPAGTFEGAVGLLSNSNNSAFFDMLDYLFSWKFILLVIFVVLSIFIYRVFCRFICPLGAIYSFFNRFALIGVKLDEKKCVDCGACINKCKMDINHVGDHECINCGECIPVCPTKAISWKGSKIILHGLDTQTSSAEKPVPLAALTTAGTAQSVSAPLTGGNGGVTVVVPEETEEERTERVKSVEARIKKRTFWLQFAAWAVALVTLTVALVYYNFIDKVDNTEVKAQLPEFTLNTVYDTAGGNGIESISSDSLLGKVTVINFWYTNCDPCIQELPDFEKIKKEYGDSVNMIVVHRDDATTSAQVQAKIDSLGWSDWQLVFTHDTAEANLYYQLGGQDVFPMTVVFDAEGTVTYTCHGKIKTENQLVDAIEDAMK